MEDHQSLEQKKNTDKRIQKRKSTVSIVGRRLAVWEPRMGEEEKGKKQCWGRLLIRCPAHDLMVASKYDLFSEMKCNGRGGVGGERRREEKKRTLRHDRGIIVHSISLP